MSNVQHTLADMDIWRSDKSKMERLEILRDLAKDAGLIVPFDMVPMRHIQNMDYDKFLITIQGLAKIKAIRENTDMIGAFVDKYGHVHYKQLEGEY